uniref:Uncharacterized protein n=1 Tax=Oryza nivara TaxID=4536 RepID=A0A0E0J7T1_ORYNI
MVMKGQRDGEPSCSSPECVQVSCLIPVVSRLIPRLDTPIMPGTCEYHDRYLYIRPGTRRYKAWYLGIMVWYQT